MNNKQVDKSNEAVHNWIIGDTHPLLKTILEILPGEISEDEFPEILHYAGIRIEGLDGLRPTWSDCMTFGKEFL